MTILTLAWSYAILIYYFEYINKDAFPDGCTDGCGCPGCVGVVVGFTDNAGGCPDGCPDGCPGCPWFVLGGAEDTLAGLLFCIGGRFVRLLIELFITPDMSIAFGT
jgi:hypothetical protein